MTETLIEHKDTTFNEFVKQLNIEDIRLFYSKISNLDCEYSPDQAEVKWRIAASYKNEENKFVAYHRYNVRIIDQKERQVKAKISVVFCVIYSSKLPMDDEKFNKFKNSSLPLNTWPYFREYLHSTIQRMGWPSFIAPTFVP